MSTLTLAEIQPFIDFVNGNLGSKPYTLQALSLWASSAGKPLVASGTGYGVTLGEFPPSGVVSVNGRSGTVTLDNTDVGLGNVPNVNCTDASNITSGTLPLSVIPAAALERLVHVADESARFLLTTVEVQNGDVVQQDDTGIMYKVVDDANLDSALGYNEFTAGVAAAVNWSGVLNVPQSLVDVASATGVDKDMLVYSAGHWSPYTPSQVRYNLDILIKGYWDMSPVLIDNSVPFPLYPPMNFDPTPIGAVPFPYVLSDGSLHRMIVEDGVLEASPGYVAASDAFIATLVLPTSDTADLPFPTVAGTQNPLLVSFSTTLSQALSQELGTNSLPANFPEAVITCQMYGRDVATNDLFMVLMQFAVTYTSEQNPTGCFLSVAGQGRTSGVSFSSTVLKQDIALPIEDLRVVLYFDADTRQVGVIVGGVDHGWLETSSNVPLMVSPTIETMGLIEVGSYQEVATSDLASIGQTMSVFHSISLADISEPSPLSPFTVWTQPNVTTVDPSLPAGAEISNRFIAWPGGSFGGITVQTGDLVEVTDPDTSLEPIFVYPKASSLARLTDLFGYATTADLSNVQNDVTALSSSLTAVDGRVTSLENSFSTIDNRTIREKFLTGMGKIVGASSNGNDLHAPFANTGDAVIVTSFTDTYVGITGQFASFPLGSLAVRGDNDNWLNFTPQPGDEYAFISNMYASEFPNTETLIPLVFKMTYIGGEPGVPLPQLGNIGGTFISSQFAVGYQDRSPLAWEAGYAQMGGAFRQLGWMMHPQANGPRGERVKYHLVVTSNQYIEVNPLVDDVVYILNSSQESVVDIRVLMPKPVDNIGSSDASYAWIATAATRKTRVVIEGVVGLSNNFPVFVRQYPTLGENSGGGRHAIVAQFLYRGVQSTNPSDNASGNLAYGSRGMLLDVWVEPSGSGYGMPQPTVRTERLDRGGIVCYDPNSYPDGRDSPDVRVLHWESPIVSQYVPALGRAVTWMVLPPPTQDGVRLLVRAGFNYTDADGPQYSVIWTTTPNETGIPVGLKAGTDVNLPTFVRQGQVFEFVCVRQNTTSWPAVSLSADLVWSWVPPAVANEKIAKFEESIAGGWASQWWQPSTPSTHLEATLTGPTNNAAWGSPFTVGLDTDSLRSHHEGEVITIRVKGDNIAGASIAALRFRNNSANTVDLPGTIDRILFAPFDVVTAFKVVHGTLEFVSQEVLQEKKAAEVLLTPISKVSVAASAYIYIAGGGAGSDGWPLSTKLPAVGEYAVATHRVTVQAYSGTTRAYFKEMIVRVKHNGVSAAKVAETVVYEDKDNVTSEISVSIDVTSFFVGDGTTFLGVVGQSTVAETIRWTGRIESIYG